MTLQDMALAGALTMLGLSALALAMDRHATHLPGAFSGRRWRPVLRALGCAALAAALACTMGTQDRTQALVAWLGLLAPATLIVAGAMTFANRNRSSNRTRQRGTAGRPRSGTGE